MIDCGHADLPDRRSQVGSAVLAWSGRFWVHAAEFARGRAFWPSLGQSSTSRGIRFRSLLAGLGTLMLNQVSLPGRPDSRFPLASEPTGLQARAFELRGMDPDRDACKGAKT